MLGNDAFQIVIAGIAQQLVGISVELFRKADGALSFGQYILKHAAPRAILHAGEVVTVEIEEIEGV